MKHVTNPQESFRTERLIQQRKIRFSEIISAFSCALDITQGHPQGHSMRSCLIGMRLAKELRLDTDAKFALFYAALLKDLGCSSNAAKMSYLFGTDDRALKRAFRMVDWTRPSEGLQFCWGNCAAGQSPLQKIAKFTSLVTIKSGQLREIAEIRCDRGAQIARKLSLPELVSQAIYHLDEHWNGRGGPKGLKGQAIPLIARICGLSQSVEVFFRTFGLENALEMARQRRGKWFDPQLVDLLLAVRTDTAFWAKLAGDDLASELARWEPEDAVWHADELCLDAIAESFAMVVDAKSPWTYQHSSRVAEIADGIADQLDCALEVRRDIRRAALLHDLGKLGVSNAILDKPGRPTDAELAEIRKHPDYTQRILQRVGAFAELADVAAGHHERLDGRGYHRGRQGNDIPWVARILAVADIFEALSAERPYRKAMPFEQVRNILTDDAGSGVDPECLAALLRWHDRAALAQRIDQQMDALEHVLASV